MYTRILTGALALALLSSTPAMAAELAAAVSAPVGVPDLSTAAKAIESFFKAAKAGDEATLKLIVSPRIQAEVTKGGKTLLEFGKMWDGEAEFVSAEEPAAADIKEDGRADVRVTVKLKKSGKVDKGGIRMLKTGTTWQLDER